MPVDPLKKNRPTHSSNFMLSSKWMLSSIFRLSSFAQQPRYLLGNKQCSTFFKCIHIHTSLQIQLWTPKCDYACESADSWSSELISATECFQEIAQQPHIWPQAHLQHTYTHTQTQTNTCKTCGNRISGKDVHLRNCKCLLKPQSAYVRLK